MNRALKPTLLAITALTLLITTGFLSAQTKSFETAVVRPCAPDANPNTGSWTPPGRNRFVANHLTLERLLMLAYGVDATQIANKPAWLQTNLYDVNAKAEDSVQLNSDDLKTCLQGLLKERFHLQAHNEIRSQHGYALITSKNGAHLIPTKGDHFPGFRANVNPGHIEGFNWTMPYLARMITSQVGFPVVDQTGIPGSYDIHILYEPDPNNAEATLPPLTAAIRQSLGLELKPAKIPVDTVVIDQLDKTPIEN
jgi:uncharacterized protein (TIGR03435 family)